MNILVESSKLPFSDIHININNWFYFISSNVINQDYINEYILKKSWQNTSSYYISIFINIRHLLSEDATSNCYCRYPGVINGSNTIIHNFNTRRSIFFYFTYFVLHMFSIILNEFREKLIVRIVLIRISIQNGTSFLLNVN